MESEPILRIVSGGQTGADRAALDWALNRGWQVGGRWSRLGDSPRTAPSPDRYPLKETDSSACIMRTKANVRDSDATVIFSFHPSLFGGSLATRDCAIEFERPWLHLSRDNRDSLDALATALRDFLRDHPVKILNIAGPRESEEPAIGAFVTAVLDTAFS